MILWGPGRGLAPHDGGMEEPMTTPRLTAACVVGLIALLGACSGDGDDGDPPRAESTASSEVTEPAADLPSGWTEQRAGELVFALPQDFRQSGGNGTDQGSQTTWTLDDGSEVPARVDVFVEESQVGTLEIRGGLLRSRLEAELGAQVGEPEPVEVVGASDAEQFTYTYEIDTSAGRTPVRQVDLLVDRPSLPKYGIRYAATADAYDQDVWEQLRSSLVLEGSNGG